MDVPKQHNTHDENNDIKKGRIPEDWTKSEKAAKLAQKDVDARWIKKRDEVHYGYKSHAKCDAESKFITDFKVADAAVHDS